MVLNLLPDSENAKFPFRANAGGNEVTYKLGYIPAARPVQTAIPAESNTNGSCPANVKYDSDRP